MGIHLLVVGQHGVIEPPPSGERKAVQEIHNVYREAKKREKSADNKKTKVFRVIACPSPDELVKRVREVVVHRGAMIDLLDLYDHGGFGHLSMGSSDLFHYSGTGRLVARTLRPLLTRDARVRLLGCETAKGDRGRQLLGALREEFGGSVIVYGTIGRTDPFSFQQGLFRQHLEETLLFSSTEAVTQVAPTPAQRLRELVTWYASHQPSTT